LDAVRKGWCKGLNEFSIISGESLKLKLISLKIYFLGGLLWVSGQMWVLGEAFAKQIEAKVLRIFSSFIV
jgi:hypothetical protein